jgi:hypothetical protein
VPDDEARVHAEDLEALAKIAAELAELYSPDRPVRLSDTERIDKLEADRKIYMEEIESVEGRRPDLRATSG